MTDSTPIDPKWVNDLCVVLGDFDPSTGELSAKGNRALWRLIGELQTNPWFESRDDEDLGKALEDATKAYRSLKQRPKNSGYASDALQRIATTPECHRYYFGTTDLSVPTGLRVGAVTFMNPTDDPDLLEVYERYQREVPELCAVVEGEGGTQRHALERARRQAEQAIALLRQRGLFGRRGRGARIYQDQVAFGLTGWYLFITLEGPNRDGAGGWRQRPRAKPLPFSFMSDQDLQADLDELTSRLYGLQGDMFSRAITCLECLDLAASDDRWRARIPFVFSGIEAIVVPETIGRKGAVVAVRSAALHTATRNGFFDPGMGMAAYQVRDGLVHGSLPSTASFDIDPDDLAFETQFRGYLLLQDFLDYAATGGYQKVNQLTKQLDENFAPKVCEWLVEVGKERGQEIVDEYRESLNVTKGNTEISVGEALMVLRDRAEDLVRRVPLVGRLLGDRS